MGKVINGALVAVVAVLVVVMTVAEARASQRDYVWTQEYATLGKGSAEIEFYKTAVTRDRASGQTDWTQQLELEYGITDRLNVGLYEVYEQPAESKTVSYAGYKLEVKYRVAERNDLPVDILLYGEHEASALGASAFEGKLIFSKDIGKANVSYNQIYKYKYSPGKTEHEYAAAVSYEIVPWLRFGVESKGNYTDYEYSAGPTLSWTGNRIWANLGALYALNSRTNDQEVRFILGVPF